MNVRIVKEIRPLLPAFALTLCGLIIALILWNAQLGYWGLVISAFGCILMGVSTFGDEFGNRTMPMLLSQPFSRQTIWREKMTVLAAAIGILLGAALICLYLVSRVFVPEVVEAVVMLILFCLGVFCTTPCWTLQYKSVPIAAAVSVGPPIALESMAVWILSYVPALNRAAQAVVLLLPLLAYFFVCYRWGRLTFLNLQALDAQVQDIALPPRMEQALVRPIKSVIPRFTSPWSSLINKELHLQRVIFLLAALFCIMVPLEYVIWKLTTWHTGKEIAVGILGATFVIFVILVPLITGAGCVAEEKNWKIHEWHLTFPPSKLKQWCVKVLIALTITLVLGILLPGIFLAISNRWEQDLIYCALFSLFMACLGVFASSISTNSMRAILLTIVLVVLGAAVAVWAFIIAIRADALYESQFPGPIRAPNDESGSNLWPSILNAVVLSCVVGGLILYFGFLNFRTNPISSKRAGVRSALIVVAILVAIWITAFTFSFLQQIEADHSGSTIRHHFILTPPRRFIRAH